MIKHTWSTKPKNGTSHDFVREAPTTIDESKLIVAMFGSVPRMINRAVAQWTVDVATGLRERLPNVPVAEAHAASFVADGSKGSMYVPTATKAEVDDQQFTESQRAFVEERLRIIAEAVEAK